MSTAPDARIEAALASQRGDPVELVDPPSTLWSAIEASLHDDPVEGPTGAGSVVEYRIDADDVIVVVGEGWAAFAEANEAPELVGAATGRRLWDAIAPGAVQDLWRAAVDAVRASGRATTVPFRCDGPRARRWYEMTLTSGPDGHVTFRSRLVFEMERPEIAELRRGAVLDDGPGIDICCWCAEASDGTGWRAVEEVLATSRALETAPHVTHGFCERCAVVARADLLAHR
jgi:hypothetical protein